MKNGLVVKNNSLINASYNLETTEQRLIMLAIMSARDTGQGITADSKLEIHASDYANQFNVTNETAYEVLKSAVNNLFLSVSSAISLNIKRQAKLALYVHVGSVVFLC